MTTRDRTHIIWMAEEAGICHKTWDEQDKQAVVDFYTIVANRVKDQCAALCYEQNWELRGEEMAEMILTTKEEVK